MTRWAIVQEGPTYLVVPESKVGNMKVFCWYTGHREGAWTLANSKTKDEYHNGRFRPENRKTKPVIPEIE